MATSASTLPMPSANTDSTEDLCEEVEQWVADAEQIQKELKAVRSTVKDPEGPVPATKPTWPMFLSSDDDGENAPTLKKALMEPNPQQHLSEPVWSPSVEVIPAEQPPATCRKGCTKAQVAEVDKIPQLVVKQGYPEHAFLLRWRIFISVNGLSLLQPEIIMKPTKCGQCLCYGHTCSGQVGKMCGRCIHDHQGCFSPEEYEVKEEKDAWKAKAKERGTKVKAKGKVRDKGALAGMSSISLRGILADFQIPPKVLGPLCWSWRKG
ncbi:hypothetical protein JB92DRAFT_2830469 [Gautieria morchelliformis]|nr:hypothetical protein JB92DRAFT_2830469 [Gautieria morchelliformis]